MIPTPLSVNPFALVCACFVLCGQENAELSVRHLLQRAAKEAMEKQGTNVLSCTDYLDDGSPICLKVTVDGDKGTAHFDFSGSGDQVLGNLNTPRAVVYSGIIYCLRCMVGHEIPLNQGCLAPVTIEVGQRRAPRRERRGLERKRKGGKAEGDEAKRRWVHMAVCMCTPACEPVTHTHTHTHTQTQTHRHTHPRELMSCGLRDHHQIPRGSVLWPDDTAAVVGGNVLTSQRVCDVVLKAFGACADSQVREGDNRTRAGAAAFIPKTRKTCLVLPVNLRVGSSPP